VRLEDVLSESLALPVDPFAFVDDAASTRDPAPRLEGFERELFQRLQRLGYDVLPTIRSPFDALSKREATTLLTGVGGVGSALDRKADIVSNISRVVEKDSVMFAVRRARMSIRGGPVIAREELRRPKGSDDVEEMISETKACWTRSDWTAPPSTFSPSSAVFRPKLLPSAGPSNRLDPPRSVFPSALRSSAPSGPTTAVPSVPTISRRKSTSPGFPPGSPLSSHRRVSPTPSRRPTRAVCPSKPSTWTKSRTRKATWTACRPSRSCFRDAWRNDSRKNVLGPRTRETWCWNGTPRKTGPPDPPASRVAGRHSWRAACGRSRHRTTRCSP